VDSQISNSNTWLRKGLAGIVILLGVIGLITSLVLGVILYQVGSFLGETWATTNQGIKQSSRTLLAAQETVNVTRGTVRVLEEGLGDAAAATESVDQGLVGTERTTNSVANSLSAFGGSLEAAGSAIPPAGELRRLGTFLAEAGSEAKDASRSMDSLGPVLQDLRGETDDIGQALDKTRKELPKVRSSLTEVSQGLGAGAATLESVATDLEVLRGSGVFLWIFIAGLVYFSALSLCLVSLGVLLLTI
jgi:ABC-type transporter Mla subunit MlaD